MAFQQPTLEELFSNEDPSARPEPEKEPAAEAVESETTEEVESQPAETEDAETPAAESDETEPAPAAEPDTGEAADDDFSDIPESIRRTLEARPDDADNWRNLKGIAKDAQSAAREAAEAAAALRAEKARLEGELAAYKAAQTQPQAPAPQPAAPQAPALPDPEIDPAGYARALVQAESERLRMEMRNDQLDRFEADAVRAHGKDAVEAAFAWAQTRAQADPAFGAQFGAAHDPWDFVVKQHAQQTVVSEMGDDPQAYIRQREEAAVAAAMAKFQAENGQATEQQVAAEIAKRVPRSLAKVPGATGARVEPVWNGPPPLDSIVGPQAK